MKSYTLVTISEGDLTLQASEICGFGGKMTSLALRMV